MRLKLFITLVLILFTFSIFSKNVVAQTTSISPSPFIKYDLAYPGILPDNPLYKLKVLRDKIIVFFISDPHQKVDFYLLQTDKGILASAMLVDKHEIELAQDTAFKAENNFTLLTQALQQFPQKPNAKFFEKLKTAGLKHQEVMNSIIKRIKNKDKKPFEEVIEFSKRNLKTIEDYELKY